jgi:hypothetical protein
MDVRIQVELASASLKTGWSPSNSKSDNTEGLLVSEAQLNQITALNSDSFDTGDAFHQLIS